MFAIEADLAILLLQAAVKRSQEFRVRIAHLVESLDPAGGGPPQVAARLAAAQAALGHQVTIVSRDAASRIPAIADMMRNIPGVQLVFRHALPVPGSSLELAQSLLRAPASLCESIAQHDILHLHGLWTPWLLQGARHARKLGVPYVVRPAGMLDPWSLAQKAIKKRVALALGYRTMLDGAHYIHALNADEVRLMGPLSLRAPVNVIPNGVFIEEIEPLPSKGEFRRAYPVLGESPFVLFLARLHYKKGLDVLAEAFDIVAARYPEVGLVVAGPDEGAGRELEDWIRRMGHQERVVVTGALYGRLKYAALVDATCFCLPSRQEGFSVAVTEAMACGLPVIISDECHFPEVEVAGAGKVLPLDKRRFADALCEVLKDEELQRTMALAGRTLIRERYTWPSIAKRAIEAYGG